MDEKDNIELRSEKVRNIIGGVPPRLVRAGTVVIITICVALALAAWLIKIDGTPVWRMIFFSSHQMFLLFFLLMQSLLYSYFLQ